MDNDQGAGLDNDQGGRRDHLPDTDEVFSDGPFDSVAAPTSGVSMASRGPTVRPTSTPTEDWGKAPVSSR